MATQNEFNKMIENRGSLNPKTITNYQNTYKRLIKLLDKTIGESSVKEIIKAIASADITASAKITLLIVATNIVQSQERLEDLIKLEKYRDILNDALKEDNATRAITQKLPSGKSLIDYTNSLYDDAEYREFIVNYLLINFGVRNKDLSAIITRDKSMINERDNWLFVSDNEVEFIRFDYKTADKYGARFNTITDERVIDAIKKLLLKKSSVYLLATKNGKRISDSSIGTIIKRMTMDLGEGKYFKIMLKHYGKDNFEKMTASRGTSNAVAQIHYDLDFKNEVSKAKQKADKMTAEFI